MEILVGAIILMWILTALKGGNSYEAKVGWFVLAIIFFFWLLVKL